MTQVDGSLYARGNCGPASLAMAMDYYGESWSVRSIRRDVQDYDGDMSQDAGASWQALANAAAKRDFIPIGLYAGGSAYRTWYVDDLVTQTKKGRPVILLVRYWYLPDHEHEGYYGDHYIVFLGLTPDERVVYHDAAFVTSGEGAYKTMGQDQLVKAWTGTYTGLRRTAMALVW